MLVAICRNITTTKFTISQKMNKGSNHAIVYGASGLIGWALVDQLLSAYLEAGSFSKVTAVTNRPLNASDRHWPEPDNLHRPDLQLISNIDLRRGDGSLLANSLKQVVNDVESVTHVYYLGESCSYTVERTQAYCYIKFLLQSTMISRRLR